MSKKSKIIGIILISIVVFMIGAYLFIVAGWNGTFNFAHPKEIASYNSPEGEYTLIFEQMGDPEWPFGPTDVRLTLKNQAGKIVERVSTQLNHDGANASEYNLVSVFWDEDAVVIVLRASEMEDKEVTIKYNK